jgi:pyruvate formate lyase activating enzyme
MQSFTIKGFIETSMLDWWGKLAAVLFLPGCNFRCPYCHNPELASNPNALPDIPLENVLVRLSKFKGWIDGIVITGGEPTMHDNLPDFIRHIKQKNWSVKLDTNGSRPDMLAQLLDEGVLDYVAMDVKSPLNELDYQRATGRGTKVEAIRESIGLLKASGLEYELRTTVCPTLLDKTQLKQLLDQIKGAKRLVLQNFKPAHVLDIGFQQLKPYSKEYIHELGQLSEKYVKELRLVA